MQKERYEHLNFCQSRWLLHTISFVYFCNIFTCCYTFFSPNSSIFQMEILDMMDWTPNTLFNLHVLNYNHSIQSFIGLFASLFSYELLKRYCKVFFITRHSVFVNNKFNFYSFTTLLLLTEQFSCPRIDNDECVLDWKLIMKLFIEMYVALTL